MPYHKLNELRKEEKKKQQNQQSAQLVSCALTMHVGEMNEGTSVHVQKLIDLCLHVGILWTAIRTLAKHKMQRSHFTLLVLHLVAECRFAFKLTLDLLSFVGEKKSTDRHTKAFCAYANYSIKFE